MNKESFLAGCFLLFFLSACGGGGNAGDQGASTNAAPVVIPPNSLEKLMNEGLYRVSYGTGTSYEPIDKSLFVTRIDSWNQTKDLAPIKDEFYAGENPRSRFSVFDEASRITIGFATWHSLNSYVDFSMVLPSQIVRASTGESLSFDLEMGYPTSANPTEVPAFNIWTVKLFPEVLDGRSISEIVKATKPKTKPYDSIPLTGNFPVGSRSYRLTFESKKDVIYNERTSFAYGRKELTKWIYCSPKAADGSSVNLQFEEAGKFNIHRNPLGNCDSAALGVLMGVGTWTDEKIEGVDYTFFKFPTNFPASQYNNRFDQSSYDSGVRLGKRWDHIVDGKVLSREATVHQIPKGVVVVRNSTMLNKTAADAIKVSAGWK